MRKRNKVVTTILAIIMVFPLFLGLGSAKDVSGVEKSTQTVTLHKRAFDTLPTSPIQNTGDLMEFDGEGLNGAVFSAYDVSQAYWTVYESTEGTDTAKTNAARDAVLAADFSVDGIEPVEFAPTKTVDGEDGISSAELEKKSPVTIAGKTTNRNAIYLFKETASPAGVVQNKSIPFVLGLPIYDEESGEEKTNVHVYPKNEVEALTLEFTKFGVDPNKTTANEQVVKLGNAEFILMDENGNYYQNSADGIGFIDDNSANAFHFSSNSEGLVTTGELTLAEGTYEFYEVDSEVAVSGKQSGESELFHYKKNPAVTVEVSPDMELTYYYYDQTGDNKTLTSEDLEENANLTAEVYNYKVPEPKKVADDQDVDKDQVFNFTITQKIPQDIEDYETFQLVDEYDERLALKSTKAEIEEALELYGATVTIDANNSTFTVTFDIAQLVEFKNQEIRFNVEMSVKDASKWVLTDPDNTAITNTVTLENSFYDKTASDFVKTYGKKFVKKDADTDANLAGAEFYVKKGTEYLVIAEDGTYSWGTKNNAFVFSSNAAGEFEVAGLAKAEDGSDIKYHLEEKTAPEGYAKLVEDVEFAADNGTTTLTVANKHKGSLPSTGGTGIVAFVLIGVVAVGGAVLYFTKGRRQIEG